MAWDSYLVYLAILEAQPEKATHIGGLPETDLAGARTVGVRAVLFLGVSHRQDGRPLADAVFEEYVNWRNCWRGQSDL